MVLFFILLYAAVCIIHLSGCILKKDTLCAWTKCLLMPLLTLASISFAISAGNKRLFEMALIAAALLFATAGDALLLFQSDRAFMAGALSFLIGHIAWMASARKALMATSIIGVAIWIGIAGIALFFLYRLLGKPSGVMGAGIVIYGFILIALAGTGIAAVHNDKSTPSFMFLIGGISFFISDGILAYSRFISEGAYSRFIIMITYIIAETLLAFSTVCMI